MYLCQMTGAKKHIHKYIALHCSKLFNSKVYTGFPLSATTFAEFVQFGQDSKVSFI